MTVHCSGYFERECEVRVLVKAQSTGEVASLVVGVVVGVVVTLVLEYATLEWVDWFNHRRLFHELGRIPPAEYEENYYVQSESGHQVETHTTEPA